MHSVLQVIKQEWTTRVCINTSAEGLFTVNVRRNTQRQCIVSRCQRTYRLQRSRTSLLPAVSFDATRTNTDTDTHTHTHTHTHTTAHTHSSFISLCQRRFRRIRISLALTAQKISYSALYLLRKLTAVPTSTAGHHALPAAVIRTRAAASRLRRRRTGDSSPPVSRPSTGRQRAPWDNVIAGIRRNIST